MERGDSTCCWQRDPVKWQIRGYWKVHFVVFCCRNNDGDIFAIVERN